MERIEINNQKKVTSKKTGRSEQKKKVKRKDKKQAGNQPFGLTYR